MKIKPFQLYTVDPISNSFSYWYPQFKMLGLFVNSNIAIKLMYFFKGYPSFSKDRGIIRHSIWG